MLWLEVGPCWGLNWSTLIKSIHKIVLVVIRDFRSLWLIQHGDFPYQFPKLSAVGIYQIGDISPHWLQLITLQCNYWKRFTALHAAQFNSTIFNAFTHYSTWLYSPLRKLIHTKPLHANKVKATSFNERCDKTINWFPKCSTDSTTNRQRD